MPRPRPLLILALLPLLLSASGVRADEPTPSAPVDPWTFEGPLQPEAVEALEYALSAQLLTLTDLGFKKNYGEVSGGLSLIERSLDDPLSVYDTTWSYGRFFDTDLPFETLGTREGAVWLREQLDLQEIYGLADLTEAPDWPPPPEVGGDASVGLTRALAAITSSHVLLWDFLPPEENAALLEGALSFTGEGAEPPPAPAGYDSYQDAALAQFERMQLTMEATVWPAFLDSAIRLGAFTDTLARTIASEPADGLSSDLVSQQLSQLSVDGMTVVVGTEGNDTFSVYPGTLIFDPGGDDTYYFPEGPPEPMPLVHWILDMEGDDRYLGQGAGAAGGGYGGVALIEDYSGNDVYRTGPISQGSGLFGSGLLIDRQGSDLYDGGDFCQGAGMFGFGLLWDGGGNDDYRATLYAQGCALTGGLGCLIERGGNDTYFAGGLHIDYPRWPEHYLSLSQGFAIGLRPDAAGGIAFLGDFAGNDFYNAEIYGQGVAYWYSLGMLLDVRGHDWYQCQQYGQGAGIHLAAGCLIDVSGIDHYNGWADLQGTGHDLGAGMFLEMSGRDFMAANDLSQGAGNANGLGVAIDLAGDDAWLARNESNNQGYGNPRRDFGSIGVLVDLKGKDMYSIPGHADGSLWTSSLWGVGYDADAPLALEPVKFIPVSGTSGQN